MDLSAYRNVVDLQNICRTCLKNQNCRRKIEKETICVDSKSISVLELLGLLHEIKLQNGFPDEICSSCMQQLHSFYEFKLQVEKSESVLKKHLGPFDNKNNNFNPLSQSNLTFSTRSFNSSIAQIFIKKDLNDEAPDLKVSEADIDLGPLKISDDPFNEKNSKKKTVTNEKRKRKKVSEHTPDKQEGENQEKQDAEAAINLALCTICNKTFKSKYILNVHLKRHKFAGQFVCTLCGKGFNSRGCLNRHTRVHTGEKNYQCDICQKRFPSSNNLNIHLRTHTGEKPYLCNLCGKSFTNRTGLNFHVRTHSKERPYGCDVCGKSFGAQSHLEWHKMIHTGVRPFPCDQCDKAFIKKCDLQRHQSVHTGEKPYCCNFCDKRFSTKVHLQYHTMVHTDDRPHMCHICSKRFIRRYYLRDHMLKQHGTLDGTTLEEKEPNYKKVENLDTTIDGNSNSTVLISL